MLPVIFKLLLLLTSTVGLFLSLWTVITAPVFSLYPLSVGAPEISPWLLGLHGVALLLSGFLLQPGWLKWTALGLSLTGLVLSSLPLVQLPTTIQQIETSMKVGLGADYLAKISSQQAQLRSHPFTLAETVTGINLPPVRQTANIQFATPNDVPLALTVYRPSPIGVYPAVVMIHGGAWRSGSPADHEPFNRYLAAQGYTVVAISYRLAPGAKFPAQLEDVQTAIDFIQQHAAEYEIDVNRMAIMGRSAGGHLAMLAAFQPQSAFKAVVNYYSPVDLTEGYRNPPKPDPIDSRQVLQAFLGGTPDELPTQYQQASPITFVRSGLPPTLLIYGGRDHVVQAKYGRQLYQRLRSLGNTSVFIEIPWAEHAFDAVFNGVSNQLALYYTERFLAWALRKE